MDKKYIIKESEVTKNGSTNGRAWQITKMTLIDETGVETEGVSTFNTVKTGETIEGKIVTNEKGYLNFVAKETPKQVAGANFKSAQIEKTMERKEQSIGKFQDIKELSIKTSSTMRDAVILTVAERGEIPMSDEELSKMVIKWRKWLWNHFDVDLDDVDAITGKLN